MRAILDDTWPNFVADRSTAEQLAYHGRRLQRFYDYDPCGTTKIHVREDIHCGLARQMYLPRMAYHDGKVAWIDKIDMKKDLSTRLNVQSILDGVILCKEPRARTGLDKVALSSRLVAVTSRSV